MASVTMRLGPWTNMIELQLHDAAVELKDDHAAKGGLAALEISIHGASQIE